VQKLFDETLFDQIVELGHVDRFVPGEYIVLNDIKVLIPENVYLFDKRGRLVNNFPIGSFVGIAHDPNTQKIVAIVELSREKLKELIDRLKSKEQLRTLPGTKPWK